MKILFYLNLFFVLFLISCSNSEEKLKSPIEKVKIKNNSGVLLLSGQMKNDTLPYGLWTFYNDKEKLILELEFNDSNNLSIKQYSRNGKIIYDAYYINGKLLEEKKCADFEKINYDNGRYLFNKYLDPYFNSEFGKIKKESLSDLKIKIDFLRSKYKNIPIFNDNEMKAIVCFFNPNGANIRL
ncbi:hypothetical protein EV143_101633 [Flavobacterium chryseum]|uniref:Lipoprotein n=1 Tax=Flavobacterium circumlabens TaxID=2133765 RepID=A0A4Y7U807_9FLAO|nr:hypothetical protein [Flavobacterium]TCN53839.1 hypothetical protein EV142_108144 [Flavobacterium circumlabens]TDO84187.1 hypothetical protein EV143_101633 [Flavobacterium sp. P3160]TEB42565.1 hypothetical protein D0809_19595 [Flavobacterium circumlabens]